MPDTVVRTGKEILLGCRSLEHVHISHALAKIECGLLARCRKLQSVSLPPSVHVVCDGAFAECRTMTSFSYACPDIVMGKKVFDGCDALLSNPAFVQRMKPFIENQQGRK